MLAMANIAHAQSDSLLVVYKLHGQTRKYQYTFSDADKGRVLNWGIERNTKWQSGSFTITGQALRNADQMSFLQPVDGEHVVLPDNTSYLMISAKALSELKKNGHFIYNGTRFNATGQSETRDGLNLIEAHDPEEGCTMWILDRPDRPLIWEMKDNPLEINWTVSDLSKH